MCKAFLKVKFLRLTFRKRGIVQIYLTLTGFLQHVKRKSYDLRQLSVSHNGLGEKLRYHSELFQKYVIENSGKWVRRV